MKRTFALALAAAALVVAGCGSDDEGSDTTASDTGSAGTTPAPKSKGGGGSGAKGDDGGSKGGGASTNLKISADPSGALKFDKSSLTAKPGNVTITMDNPSSVPHGVGIEGKGVDEHGETVNKGGTSTATASLKPGKYEFYCPVPGHEQGGMKGTLTVK